MIPATPLPLHRFLVPVENMDTGEKALLVVDAVCALDAPAAGCHAAFVREGYHWQRTRAFPVLTACWS